MSVDRIANARLRDRVVSAEAAAALIQPGETVAMSGFTGSGYPKAVPVELARRIEAGLFAERQLAGDAFDCRVEATRTELEALIAQGVPANRITATSGGESDPVDTNATAQGRAENRRTELTVLSK